MAAALPGTILLMCAVTTSSPLARNHDELEFLTGALRLLGEGRLTGYNHGPVMYELLGLMHAIAFGALWLIGAVNTSFEYVVYFVENPSLFLTVGRLMTVVTALVALRQLHRVARIFLDAHGAAIAVLLAGTNLTFVALSSTIKEEPLFWAAILAASVSAWEASNGASVWPWRRTGALIGLATATKYFGVFWILLVALAFRQPRPMRAVINAVLSATLTAAVLTPFLLTDTERVFRSIAALNTGSAVYGGSPTYRAYLLEHLPNLVGWPLLAAAVAQAAILARKCDARLWLVAPPAVLLAWLGSRNGVSVAYYAAPLGYWIVILCCRFATDVGRRLHIGRLYTACAVAITGVVLGLNAFAAGSIKFALLVRSTDTRQQAATYLASRVPDGECVAVGEALRGENFYGPPLTPRERPAGGGVLARAQALAWERLPGARYDLRRLAPGSPIPPDCSTYVQPVFALPKVEFQDYGGESPGTPSGFSLIHEVRARPADRPFIFPYLVSTDYDAFRRTSLREFARSASMGWTLRIYRRADAN